MSKVDEMLRSDLTLEKQAFDDYNNAAGAGLTVTLDSMAVTTVSALTGWYIIEGF